MRRYHPDKSVGMYIHSQRPRPKPWAEHVQSVSPRLLFFHRMEWCLSWAAWALGQWALLEVLDYLGSFSILVVVILYFADTHNRIEQRHYQAWQVINTAQGKGGSGGRIDALQELNADHVSLVGVDASQAFLQGVDLPHANLARCDLHSSDMRMSVFRNATMTYCDLRGANFRNSNMRSSHLENTDLTGADLHGTNLRGAVLDGAVLDDADLRLTDLNDISWQRIASMRLANIWGVKNAPAGFVAFALAHGAVSLNSDAQWEALEAKQDGANSP